MLCWIDSISVGIVHVNNREASNCGMSLSYISIISNMRLWSRRWTIRFMSLPFISLAFSFAWAFSCYTYFPVRSVLYHIFLLPITFIAPSSLLVTLQSHLPHWRIQPLFLFLITFTWNLEHTAAQRIIK